ncbi:MAG: carboxymuconolactone decarboxylase family protein, partial [Acidimicrobiia bacterium]|nr:carboxymuconolactone decarboxylase family protein [Acidimicrobiia bacterium]
MDRRDPFPRRTATPLALLPWIAELGKNLPGLLRSYLPGQPLDPRTRERVILAVTEVNGCRYCAWIHGSWQDFLGENSLVDADEALLAYARACAEA